jgi:hypothetical protein
MRLAPSILALIGLLSFAPPALAGTIRGSRYYSDGGAYSIDMSRPTDRYFRQDKETSNGDSVVTQFIYAPGATIWNLTANRTIEWLRLAQPIALEQNDRAAQDLVDGYLAARYPDVKYTISARRKSRTENGQLYYVFDAKGRIGDNDMNWQFCVLPFDKAIALVAQTTNLRPGQLGDGTFDEAPFLRWATSIQPGS